MLINGIHHVCIKCRMDQVKKVKEFYTEVLGLPVVRSWGEPELAGFVFDSGAGLIEVFTNAQEDLPQGSIRHFAFATSDVDQCVKAVRGQVMPLRSSQKMSRLRRLHPLQSAWHSALDRLVRRLSSIRKNDTAVCSRTAVKP